MARVVPIQTVLSHAAPYAALVAAWLALLFGPYYVRPAPSDFLAYARAAGAGSADQFDGLISERLTILLSIRLLQPFTASPADAGVLALLIVSSVSLLGAVYLAWRWAGHLAAVLSGCMVTFTTMCLLPFARDLHTEQYSIALLMLGLIAFKETQHVSGVRRHALHGLLGVLIVFNVGTKPDMVFIAPVFCLPLAMTANWRALQWLLTGSFVGTLMLMLGLLTLYPFTTITSYVQNLISLSNIYTEARSDHSVQWFSVFITPYFAWALCLFAGYPRAYAVPGVRQLFGLAGLYIGVLLTLASLSNRLQISIVYPMPFAFFLALGSALILATNLRHVNSCYFGRVGLLVVGLFVLGTVLGIVFSDSLVRPEASFGASTVYVFTPLAVLILVARAMAFAGSTRTFSLLLLVLALPQTALLNASAYNLISKSYRDWSRPYYAFTDRIAPEYVRDSPVLVYLDRTKLELDTDERITSILATKTWPSSTVRLIRGADALQQSDVLRARTIITDAPEIIQQLQAAPTPAERVSPAPTDGSATLYPLFALRPPP